jgi:hypothetical protein
MSLRCNPKLHKVGNPLLKTVLSSMHDFQDSYKNLVKIRSRLKIKNYIYIGIAV